MKYLIEMISEAKIDDDNERRKNAMVITQALLVGLSEILSIPVRKISELPIARFYSLDHPNTDIKGYGPLRFNAAHGIDLSFHVPTFIAIATKNEQLLKDSYSEKSIQKMREFLTSLGVTIPKQRDMEYVGRSSATTANSTYRADYDRYKKFLTAWTRAATPYIKKYYKDADIKISTTLNDAYHRTVEVVVTGGAVTDNTEVDKAKKEKQLRIAFAKAVKTDNWQELEAVRRNANMSKQDFADYSFQMLQGKYNTRTFAHWVKNNLKDDQ